MAIDLYWGSGSPQCWRVMLALEHKRLPWTSHPLQLARQDHKSPQMLAMNPRGRVPVLKDGDYVVFESVAVLYYLDLKYPDPPIFGRTPEEAGVIMRVIEEFQAYTEDYLMRICQVLDSGGPVPAQLRDEITDAMHVVAREARTIEGRLSRSDWIVGEDYSAIDMVIFPAIQQLRRALNQPGGRELSSRFLPISANYPALGRWLARIEALPGYERTYPPHWREQPSTGDR
ncbi:MAG: glutathione S-transferase family protein [Sinobacteraceae bacterium]|nr:glutathione S-transferase family protein [Nevskiaceae bacterium]